MDIRQWAKQALTEAFDKLLDDLFSTRKQSKRRNYKAERIRTALRKKSIGAPRGRKWSKAQHEKFAATMAKKFGGTK